MPSGTSATRVRSERSSARTKKTERPAARMAKEDEEFLRRFGDKLSASTRRAKWIGSPDEYADRKGQSFATRSHEVIKRWAEERGAQPAAVGRRRGQPASVLRLGSPGYGGNSLEKIGWDESFKTFDDRKLVFLHQEQVRGSDQSNFFSMDSPERDDA
jgi:hypothetical protein